MKVINNGSNEYCFLAEPDQVKRAATEDPDPETITSTLGFGMGSC